MENDGLPRLQPRLLMEATPLAALLGSSESRDGVNSARRAATKQSLVRASLPKSAGAVSSPQRRRIGSSSGASGVVGIRSTARAGYGGDPLAMESCDSAAVTFTQRPHIAQQTAVAMRPSSKRSSPRKSTTARDVVSPSQTVAAHLDQQLLQSQWSAISRENEQLRLEMKRLQQRLVEKMRNNAKILVGGGQFRASGAATSIPNMPPGTASASHACGSCGTLRASFKKAREEFEEAKDGLAYRIMELERGDAVAQTKLHQRHEELIHLREEIERLVTAYVAAKQRLQAQHEQIQMLTEELSVVHQQAADEERIKLRELSDKKQDMRVVQVDTATQSDEEEAERGRQRQVEAMETVEAYRLQVQTLQASHSERQATCERLDRELAMSESKQRQTIQSLELAQQEWQERLMRADDQCQELIRQREEYEIEAAARSAMVAKLEQELAACRHGFQASTEKWYEQLTEKSRCINELEQREIEYAALTASLRDRVFELEDRERKMADGGGVLTSQVHQLTCERDNLQETLQLKQTEMQRHEEATQAALKDAQTQLEAAQGALVAAQQDCEHLSARVIAAEADGVAHQEMLRKLRKSHAITLGKAMQSVVRLCVVAPTVRVHLTNSNSSASSSPVTCQASLPHAQLRRVVEQEVLPLFATVFVQPQEGASPQGTPMDPWLQSLLRDIQESLASHLHTLYTSTTATSSTSSTTSPSDATPLSMSGQ